MGLETSRVQTCVKIYGGVVCLGEISGRVSGARRRGSPSRGKQPDYLHVRYTRHMPIRFSRRSLFQLEESLKWVP